MATQARSHKAQKVLDRLSKKALITIADEDVNVSIQVKNDGEVSDTYNLTLYYDDTEVQNGVWIGQTLDPTESAFYTYTLMAQDLDRGIHNFKADLSIIHEGELVSDSEAKLFRVIDPPHLDKQYYSMLLKAATLTLMVRFLITLGLSGAQMKIRLVI